MTTPENLKRNLMNQDRLAGAKWCYRIEDALVFPEVKTLGEVVSAWHYDGEENKGGFRIYRVMVEGGSMRTVISSVNADGTSGPASLTTQDVGVLAALMLGGNFSPAIGSYQRYAAAPQQAKLDAEMAEVESLP